MGHRFRWDDGRDRSCVFHQRLDETVRLVAGGVERLTEPVERVAVPIERCGIEPDFYVRDMLTWALARQPVSITMPLLLEQAKSTVVQARSQALHTLSKIGDRAGGQRSPRNC